MKNGKEFLLTDTVGFIQKLPTTLVRNMRLLQFFSLWLLPNWYLALFFDMIYDQINMSPLRLNPIMKWSP